MERDLGLDKVRPIALSPSMQKDLEGKGDPFKDMYEEELRGWYKGQSRVDLYRDALAKTSKVAERCGVTKEELEELLLWLLFPTTWLSMFPDEVRRKPE
jgi:hypothetical protein